MLILTILYTALLIVVTSYNADKVTAHFNYYDRDGDGLLARSEYIAKFKEDDLEGEEPDSDED